MLSTLTDELMTRTLLLYGVSATPALCASIRTYIELLLRWNKKIALTTITDPLEILRFHFGESMFGAAQVPIRHGRLADVGTGAGFPAIPISMVVPGIQCVLIESNQKKATFLAEVVRTVNLSRIEIYRGRMDALAESSESFDFSISRALGIHSDFLSWSSSRLSRSGKIALWVGEDDSAKIAATAGWNWDSPVRIPASEHRVLLIGSKSAELA
jgi:16S rRNA (guanine527-N7)-methyltransferase